MTRRKTQQVNITAAAATERKPMTISQTRPQGVFLTIDEIREKFAPVQTLGASEEVYMAQDSALSDSGCYAMLQHSMETLGASSFPQFLGYGYLTGLTQNPLIRMGVEMIADEMMRNWIKISYASYDADDTQAKIDKLNADINKYKIRQILRDSITTSMYFGGCLIFIDTDAMSQDLNTDLYLDSAVFPQDSLRGFKIIEPFNITPGLYNTNNPLSKHYYDPMSWWVQGVEVADSRVIRVHTDLPPTLLLPAYNFLGIPMSQQVLDPVNHFTQCRESTARLLQKFSLTVFKTNMAEVLQGGAIENLDRRIALMVQNRDNDGVEAVDMESEDIVQINTPLSGATDIVRQSMEIVAAYFGEPAVKLWGISPNGFNATGESDMQSHYDHVASQQERLLRDPITKILKLLQMNRFGEIDNNIVFEFVPLAKEDKQAEAQINQIKATTDTMYLTNGVISGEELRQKLAADPQSGFDNIDPDEMPEDPNAEMGGMGGMAELMGMGGGMPAMPKEGGEGEQTQQQPKPQVQMMKDE